MKREQKTTGKPEGRTLGVLRRHEAKGLKAQRTNPSTAKEDSTIQFFIIIPSSTPQLLPCPPHHHLFSPLPLFALPILSPQPNSLKVKRPKKHNSKGIFILYLCNYFQEVKQQKGSPAELETAGAESVEDSNTKMKPSKSVCCLSPPYPVHCKQCQ